MNEEKSVNEDNFFSDFQKIDESGDIFRQMFKYSVIPTIIHDMQMKIINANDAALKEFGYSREEIFKKSIYELHPSEELDNSKRVLNEMQSKEKLSVETSFIRKDGTIFLAEATPCKYLVGEMPVIHVFIEDITERKRAENEIKSNNKLLQNKNIELERITRELGRQLSLRDEFIAVASHELRTPITSLAMQNEMLEVTISAGEVSNEDLKEALAVYDGQVKRLSRLVETLLDASRAGFEKLKLNLEETDLSEVIPQVVEYFATQLKEAHSEVKLSLDTGSIGRWDRLRIEQIISELLLNAVKYGGGKPIEISTIKGDETVKLIVKDHGQGISKEDQDRIFNRFERASSYTSFGGMGLGLYIVRQLVEAHKGKISVESERGSGSKFVVELPKALM